MKPKKKMGPPLKNQNAKGHGRPSVNGRRIQTRIHGSTREAFEALEKKLKAKESEVLRLCIECAAEHL